MVLDVLNATLLIFSSSCIRVHTVVAYVNYILYAPERRHIMERFVGLREMTIVMSR